jgi:hypothetical protein
VPLAIHQRSRILLWTLLALLLAGAIGFVVLLTVPAPIERWLQGRILVALRQHYQSNVQLENLHVTLIPEFIATADNFVLPVRDDGRFPPLITVKHVTVRAAFFELLRRPFHLGWVKLDGFEITVPPKQEAGTGPSATKPERRTHLANFVIDRVDADNTQLYVLRKDPKREPLQFQLRRLTLRGAGLGQPMTFQAELTNPTPPGLIETTGNFGPWDLDQPSDTKVDGHYVFQHADLSVFKGISGILSSLGDFHGVLHNIVVDGTTDTPDFKLDSGGESVHLTTKFHAIVDGTNGNTLLQPVKAHFLESDIVTNGEVIGHPGHKGKTILLDVDIHQAKVQDVLALAAKSEPPVLTGWLSLKAKLDLPPGDDTVLNRMLLAGDFRVWNARFTTEKIKQILLEVSRRGQGRPGDESIVDVTAEFAGNFHLQKSDLTFSQLQFAVPGVVAQMKGSYGLHSERVNFVGDVRLQAKVSETMSGVAHYVLIPFDPLFMKHGAGTYLPVAVGGTRQHPEVRLQLGKIF